MTKTQSQVEKNKESSEHLKSMAKIKSSEFVDQDVILKELTHEQSFEYGRVNHASKQMEHATKRFDAASDMIQEANKRILAHAKLTEVESKKACKVAKIAVAEIKDQLVKVDSILGDNVESKILQLERVAAALTTIKALSGDESTLEIVASLVKK